jgi:hypothetical protein
VAGELGVGAEAVDGADLAEQLGRRERGTTGQLEQPRRERRRLGLELAVELGDRAAEAATPAEQLARDPHLGRLLAPSELTAEPLQPDRSVECAQRDPQRRVELVQVPTQPLLRTTSLADEIVAMVDQQLQLAQPSLFGPWRVEPRLAQSSPSDGERVDQIRLASHPATTALRRRQPGRHPHQPLPVPLQRLLQATRHVTAVLQRPQPPPTNPLRPGNKLLAVARLQRVHLPTYLVDGNSGQGVLVHVHPDHDHVLASYRWGRPTSGQASIEASCQAPIKSRSTVSGRRRRHNTGKSAKRRHSGIESAAAFPNLSPQPDNTG